jgi:hypothetical protein
MENNEQQKSECNSCKSKNPLKNPKGMMVIGSYILFAVCYGTVTFIKDIIALLFK